MIEKERFDALIKLAEFRQARDRSRRELEWKFSVALWALLAASPVYITKRPNDLLLAFVLVLINFIYAFLWANETRIRNRMEVEIAFYYLEQAEKLIDPAINSRKKPKWIQGGPFNRSHWYKFWEDLWSTGLQIVVTVALSLSAWFLIGSEIIKGAGN